MHCAPENATPLPENVNAVSSHASAIVVVPATFLLSQPAEVSHATHRDVVASPQKPARHVLRVRGTHCVCVWGGAVRAAYWRERQDTDARRGVTWRERERERERCVTRKKKRGKEHTGREEVILI